MYQIQRRIYYQKRFAIIEDAIATTEENTDLTEQEQVVETEKEEATSQTSSEEDMPVNPQGTEQQESSTEQSTRHHL